MIYSNLLLSALGGWYTVPAVITQVSPKGVWLTVYEQKKLLNQDRVGYSESRIYPSNTYKICLIVYYNRLTSSIFGISEMVFVSVRQGANSDRLLDSSVQLVEH